MESWAIAGAAPRDERRTASSEAERVAFFDAAREVLPAALAHLDRKPIAQFDDREKRLMNLLLSLCHVALAVEMQGDAEAGHASLRRHLKIIKASSDLDS